MNNKKFKFSVIIPIYNVEEYLEETIESVVNQTIGFEENIQMVLVNDGSPDNSEVICLKYKDKYPNNIVYVKQKNSGVSAARNKGINYATGEYVNFLDSDDTWELDAFAQVYQFIQENGNKLNLVTGRMKFFEASTRYHMLDYKFAEGSRIINIIKEPNMMHLHITSSFVKLNIAKKHTFDKKLKYGEDAKYITEIILDQKKYGIVSEAQHNYRKRMNNSSAVQNKESNIVWYTDTLKYFPFYVLKYSQKKYGKILKYAQYVAMYDYQFRLKKQFPEIFSQEEREQYIEQTKKLLLNIDDDVILNQRYMYIEYKIYALKLKYQDEYKNHISIVDNEMKFDNEKIYIINSRKVLTLNILKVIGNKLRICGQINSPLAKDDYQIYIRDGAKLSKITLNDSKKNMRYGLDGELYYNMIFDIELKLEEKNLEFYIQYQDEEPLLLKPRFDIMTKLDNAYKLYWKTSGYTLIYKNKKIIITKSSKLFNLKCSIYLFLQLLHHAKFSVIIYRLLYHIANIFKKKEIWLISDRTTVANDNGMHLFKYITSCNDNGIRPYFVISKKSKDYKKMKQYGRVLNHSSFKYKLMFLLSDKVISSQADVWVYNAFGSKSTYFRDLYNFKFIFLQHGITKDDISDWLNIYNKDISLFVTAAKEEYKSILNGNYHYREEIVKLTGFPRYDNLSSDPQNIIAIMPTWRQNLSGKVNRESGTREYNPEFKNSEYFNFYNSLINDQRILEKMKEKKYKGIFVIHPSHTENGIDFEGNDIFEIINGFADYQKIFKEANLLISDFSSVPFDFAYMNKPVIYSQFDRETFFGNHLYNQGYFDYERDGFGPVTYDYETTVNTIINYLNNDCINEKKYIERTKKFYQYHDKNNCKRVYEEIKKL